MGDRGCSSLPPLHLPSQQPLPKGSPSSARCSRARGHLPGSGSTPSPWDGARPTAGSSSGLAAVPRSHIGGREQLCCHGGKEAAERETFPRSEESAGEEGRGLVAGLPEAGRDKPVQGLGVEGLHLPLDQWSWEMKNSSLLHPWRWTLLPQPHRLPLPHDTSWAVLSSRLLHKPRVGLHKSPPGPWERRTSLPPGLLLPSPAARAGLRLSVQITP